MPTLGHIQTSETPKIHARHRWVSNLRSALVGIAVKLGMKDFDLSSLEPAEPRVLT